MRSGQRTETQIRKQRHAHRSVWPQPRGVLSRFIDRSQVFGRGCGILAGHLVEKDSMHGKTWRYGCPPGVDAHLLQHGGQIAAGIPCAHVSHGPHIWVRIQPLDLVCVLRARLRVVSRATAWIDDDGKVEIGVVGHSDDINLPTLLHLTMANLLFVQRVPRTVGFWPDIEGEQNRSLLAMVLFGQDNCQWHHNDNNNHNGNDDADANPQIASSFNFGRSHCR